jgi:hypothetical protein
MQRLTAFAILLTLGLGSARAQDGFKPMFNGKDLTGWVNVNCAPGTFYVKDDMIITTGKPTGYLRTDRHYENFIAEFDWMHAPSPKGSVGNSGFFVWCDPIPVTYEKVRSDGKREKIHSGGYTRGIEVQVLVNLEWTDKKSGKSTATSHGDLFSIHGATCEPDRPHPLGWARSIPKENHAKGEFEWNHYRVEANDGVIKLAVNGKFVSMVSKCNPRKGYLALESEGSECRFKNLKIKELPSTNPKADEICDVDKGWKYLFTGLDLSGWKAGDAQKKHWKMSDGVLSYDGKAAGDSRLSTEKSFGDYELVCDWRYSGDGEFAIFPRDSEHEVALKTGKKGEWNRSILRIVGDQVTLHTNRELVGTLRFGGKLPESGPPGLAATGPVQFRNVFIRDLKGKD